jgi:hypothetical protein
MTYYFYSYILHVSNYKLMKKDKKTEESNAAANISSADAGEPVPDIDVKLGKKIK